MTILSNGHLPSGKIEHNQARGVLPPRIDSISLIPVLILLLFYPPVSPAGTQRHECHGIPAGAHAHTWHMYTCTAAPRPSPRTTFITAGPEQLGPMGRLRLRLRLRLRRNYWTQSSLESRCVSFPIYYRAAAPSEPRFRASWFLPPGGQWRRGQWQWGPSGPWPPCFGSFLQVTVINIA
jgi:hypothetical protein